MELLLLPVFQLLYFVSHFLYSLAQNVVSTWHLLTTIWHSTIDKISKSALYKSTSGGHITDPRGTASDPVVHGSFPQLWVSSVWSVIRWFWRYVASSVGNIFKTDRGNESAADDMTSGGQGSDPRETPADWEVPGSLLQLWVLAVWSSIRQSVRYVTAYQRDFIRILKTRWYATPNKTSSAVYTKGLAKTPRHLGVVLGQPSPSVALVASLIAQAASYGVKYVSVYDAFGEFLRREGEVLTELRNVAGGAYCFREREGEREEGLEREIERECENLPENSSTAKSEGSEKSPEISGESSENSRNTSRKSEKSPEKSGESKTSAENPEKSPEKSDHSLENSPEKSGESKTSAENPEKSPEKSDHSLENSPENSDARPIVEIKFLGVQDGRQRLSTAAEKLARDHARNFHLWAENPENSENFLVSESSGSESLVPGLRKRLKNVGVESSENSAVKIPENSTVKTPENSMVKIPENSMVKIPENSMVEIPENSTVEIPENSTVKIPENSTVKTPENSVENSDTQKPSRENSSEILGLSNSRVISESLGELSDTPALELSKSGETSQNFTPDSPNASTHSHTLRETSENLSLDPKSREISHPDTQPEYREFSPIPTLATLTATPDDPKFRETHYIPTLAYPKITLEPSKLTVDPTKLTLDHSKITLEPSKLTLDHSKLTLDPTKLTLTPNKFTLDPSIPTLARPIPPISIPVISRILSPDFPDPEVLISLGGNSTLGYPPWGLRATEIHFLGLSEAYFGLGKVMEAYAGCEQRWGR
ncbi:muscle M-line assembly protein unc-89-like [Eriocheir sinensis]|uniref:muscle M-line assembly protein unc-89-like n=1 Tax=Eriocheir sinensis TaxID=95602 RepID=UPI0021C9E527|nr:muscle M-line assembly protein unc-89-like [Eriocheir sinensis]